MDGRSFGVIAQKDNGGDRNKQGKNKVKQKGRQAERRFHSNLANQRSAMTTKQASQLESRTTD